MAADKPDDFGQWFERLRGGAVIDFLRHDKFPAWIELASRDLMAGEFGALAAEVAATGQAREVFRPSQVEGLAPRILLSRDAVLIDVLRPLWHAFGTSDELCQKAVEAAASAVANWPSEILSERDVDPIAFSSAHADFLRSMADIANRDSGTFGNAIRSSPIIDEARHVGFPVIVGANVERALSASIWLEPKQPRRAGGKAPRGAMAAVWEAVAKAIGDDGAADACPVLPNWFRSFRRFAHRRGNDAGALESAGLSLAMQLLADRQGRTLPFGIGFSGRWEGGRLRGVTDIKLKQQAAAQAGVFLFFTCGDRDKSEPLPEPVPGVRLVLLDEHLSLADVVRQVNRVCAECGLTEYRWRRESATLKTTYSPTGSRDLPDANNDDVCPVGFVGRNEALERLHQWHRESREPKGRRLHAVIGAGRTGKTTLLSRLYLHSPRPAPLLSRVEGIRLSAATFLYQVAEQDDDFLLSVVSIIESHTGENDDSWLTDDDSCLTLERQTLRLDQDGWLYEVGRDEPTMIDNDLACWTHFTDHIVLAFESGRIEIRKLSDPDSPVAVAYVLGRPDSMAISTPGNRHLLAVAAGEMTWFEITAFQPSSSV